MRRVAIVALCALCGLCGCGRLGFDSFHHIVDAPVDDGPRPDAPPSAQLMAFVVAADTYVSQDAVDVFNNFGADEELRVKLGEEHGFLRFEVAALPENAIVFSAELHVNVNQTDPGAQVGVFPMREPWLEGTQQGTPGACNWMQRDATTMWATAGGAPPNSASSMATSFAVNGTGRVVAALPPELIADWRSQSSGNFGVLLMAITDTDTRFDSRQNPQPDLRPKLVVTYVLP